MKYKVTHWEHELESSDLTVSIIEADNAEIAIAEIQAQYNLSRYEILGVDEVRDIAIPGLRSVTSDPLQNKIDYLYSRQLMAELDEDMKLANRYADEISKLKSKPK